MSKLDEWHETNQKITLISCRQTGTQKRLARLKKSCKILFFQHVCMNIILKNCDGNPYNCVWI